MSVFPPQPTPMAAALCPDFLQNALRSHKTASQAVCVQETHWGYTIRAASDADRVAHPGQILALVTGLGMLAAAFGMWLIPGIVFDVDSVMVRLCAMVLCIAVSVLFFCHASRGVPSEFQIDTTRGEIRKVTRSHAGDVSLLAAYSFDALDGVMLTAVRGGQMSRLALRNRSARGGIDVVTGRTDDLKTLSDRLCRDITNGAALIAKRKACVQSFKQM